MRRAILTIGGTAAGLAALLSFKTHTTAADVADPGASPAATTTSGAGQHPTATPTKKAMAKASSSAKAKPTTGAASGGTTRTLTGAVETTMYGPMQVKVTLDGTKITNVTVLQETSDGTESQSIDAFSIPKLTSEALAAQSARIDTVSGATQTSQGYIGSLQSALDMA